MSVSGRPGAVKTPDTRGANRLPVVLLALGLFCAASGIMLRVVFHSVMGLRLGGGALLLVGGALSAGSLVSLAFIWATARSFEGFVAWRYIRRDRPSWTALLVGLAILLVALALGLLGAYMEKTGPDFGGTSERARLVFFLRWGAICSAILGWLVVVFGLAMLAFSVFSAISVFGVHLGTTALVVVLSVMGGFEADLRAKILGTRSHVLVSAPGEVFSSYRRNAAQIREIQGVVGVSPYLESEVIATSETNHEGVLVRGIDPRRINQVSDLGDYIAAERGAGKLEYLEYPERLRARASDLPHAQIPGAIVGAELAKNLGLDLGDGLTLVAPLGGMSPLGPIPRTRRFRIVGIFYTGLYDFDTRLVYLKLGDARTFFGVSKEVSGLEIKIADPERITSVIRKIKAQIGSRLRVQDWRQLNRSLFSALKLEKVVMFIVLAFIVLVASFSIVTNLIMIVLEKSAEIASLKAIGATSSAMLKVFLYAGLYIGISGTLMGLVEGVGMATILSASGAALDPEIYYIAKLPVRMDGPDIALVAFAAVMMSFLATLHPALRAARLVPIRGLRNE